jgi:hypothetical protein
MYQTAHGPCLSQSLVIKFVLGYDILNGKIRNRPIVDCTHFPFYKKESRIKNFITISPTEWQ